MTRKPKIPLGIFVLVLLTALAIPVGALLHAASQDQPNQQNQQDQQNQQNKTNQDQTQTDQQQPKKKGGLFGGMKKVTGVQSGQESAATTSAGSKSVVDGKKIGEMTPTAADRQQVTDMENYSVPQNDLKKFQDDGHLQPKQ